MVFVAVPKEHVEKYQYLGWSELLQAARDGVDGLHVKDDPTFKTGDFQRENDHALFRDGTNLGFARPNVAALHSQGW